MSKATKKTKARKQAPPKRPPGRPSDYSREIAQVICRRLGNGESLRQICVSPGMPGKTTIMKWLESNLDFRGQYARARELQAEHWAEEIIEIADDSRNDFIEKEGRDGSTYEAVDNEHINRSRLKSRYSQMADGSTGPQEIRRQSNDRIGRRRGKSTPKQAYCGGPLRRSQGRTTGK
jgi:hypothetical protein